MIDLPVDHPDQAILDQQGYTLEGLDLDHLAPEVHRVMADLLRERRDRFVEAGVGGTWVSYRLKPKQPAEQGTFSWGPHETERFV